MDVATTVLEGSPAIEITLRRSARARRLSLRVSSLDGRVTLTLPRRTSAREALAFAADRRNWIERARAGLAAPVSVRAGAVLPIDGMPVRIEVAPTRRTLLGDGVLRVPATRPAIAAAGFLRARARDRMAALSDGHARTLGVGWSRLSLGDPRSRWGSCSSAGRLMYSWRLAMAPVEVQNYVAAHEVAHLVRMDHSPAFWAVVAGLVPDWRSHRDWLRQHGAALHRIRFED